MFWTRWFRWQAFLQFVRCLRTATSTDDRKAAFTDVFRSEVLGGHCGPYGLHGVLEGEDAWSVQCLRGSKQIFRAGARQLLRSKKMGVVASGVRSDYIEAKVEHLLRCTRCQEHLARSAYAEYVAGKTSATAVAGLTTDQLTELVRSASADDRRALWVLEGTWRERPFSEDE